MKHYLFILSSIISFQVLILYLIQTLSSDNPFDLLMFLKSFLISFFFLLLLTLIDYKLVLFANTSKIFAGHFWLRVFFEVTILVLLASAFVIIGNIPFYGSIRNYIESEAYQQSVVAAVIINLFTVTVLEYIVQLRKNQKLIRENMQIQYNELKNQINPHFLFNSLNILVSLINKDSQQAVRYTKKLSDFYRYVLSGNAENTILLESEIKFISDYVDILQIRFGKGLEVSFSINETDMKHHIVPMALQVLVENAVKHNAVASSNPLRIEISSDGRCLTVRNNIIPRTSVERGTGIGIENLEKKYMIISDRRIEIDSDDKYFTVRLPLL